MNKPFFQINLSSLSDLIGFDDTVYKTLPQSKQDELTRKLNVVLAGLHKSNKNKNK